MKCYVVWLVLAIASGSALTGQQTAHVTASCTSLRFPPASGGPGQAQTLSLTTDPTFAEINNELVPIGDPTLPAYGALFVLDDPTSLGTLTGQVYFDPPPAIDLNNDGFDDFLQVGQPAGPATTQGLFKSAVDQGTVQATWNRAAGATSGTCTVQLTGNAFGKLPAFTFTFELLTSAGTLRYTPTTNSVTGLLSLTNSTSTSNTLSGPVTLVRVASNRFNDLTLLPGNLTNQSGQVLAFPAEDIQRDTTAKTNYFGYLDFKDGDLTTATADYQTWVLSIDDTNDSDRNGVPDLSDDPAAPILTQPTLGLGRSGNHLLFSVASDLGRSYHLEQSSALVNPSWTQVQLVTITNRPQTLSLPLPNAPILFWRLSGQ